MVPSNIQLWLHSTCNCSCYRRTVADGFPNVCNELVPSTSRASHFSRQVKPSLTILKKLFASAAIVGIHFEALPEQTSQFASAASPHAWQTQQHHPWRALQLGFHAKPTQQMGMPTKSQSWELRSMALHHFAKTLSDTQVDAAKTPITTWHTRSLLLLEDKLPHTFRFSHLSQPG